MHIKINFIYIYTVKTAIKITCCDRDETRKAIN